MLSSVSINVQLEEEVVVYSSPYLERMNEVLPKHSVRWVPERSVRISAKKKIRSVSANLKKKNSDSGFCSQDNTELPHLAARL